MPWFIPMHCITCSRSCFVWTHTFCIFMECRNKNIDCCKLISALFSYILARRIGALLQKVQNILAVIHATDGQITCKLECIPVGCVPAERWPYPGGGACLEGGCLPGGGGTCLEGGVPAWKGGCLPGGGVPAWRGVPSWRGGCPPGGGRGVPAWRGEGGACLEGGCLPGGGGACLEGGCLVRYPPPC